MRVRVERARCKGYGLCMGACPEVFDLDEVGKAFVVETFAAGVPPELADAVHKAVLSCPERAVVVEADPLDEAT